MRSDRPENEKYARCITIGTHNAYSAENVASVAASSNASPSLKALAKAALVRISQRINPASDPESTRIYSPDSDPKNMRFDALHDAHHEATEERRAILEHEGGMTPSAADRVAELAHAFHAHIFPCPHCQPRHGRYCPEGARLKDRYYSAARAATPKRRPTP